MNEFASNNLPPSPEEFQKQMQDFLRQHFPGTKSFVMENPAGAESGETEEAKPKPEDFRFDHKPRDIKAYLDRFVIKQDEAKKP